MRKKQLDGLRFVSFIGIFLYHTDLERFWFGNFAVPLFFVLSGFLITNLLLEQQAPFKEALFSFYMRRFLRIFPAYYLVLTVAILFKKIQFPVWNLFYLFNIKLFLLSMANQAWLVLENWRSSGAHLWTICVEEQFYVIYPLILLAVPPKRQIPILTGLLFASILCRFAFKFFLPSSYYGILLPVCGEYLMWGSLFGYAQAKAAFKSIAPALFLYSGLALLAILFLMGRPHISESMSFHPPDRQTFFGLGFSLLILGLWADDRSFPAKFLSLPFFSYLGKISYGLYLIHPFTWELGAYIKNVFPGLSFINSTVLRFSLTVSLAALSWHFFESPINRLRKHFFNSGNPLHAR